MTEVEVVHAAGSFRGDIEIAKLFLGALGSCDVKLLAANTKVSTGADIALLILERATS